MKKKMKTDFPLIFTDELRTILYIPGYSWKQSNRTQQIRERDGVMTSIEGNTFIDSFKVDDDVKTN